MLFMMTYAGTYISMQAFTLRTQGSAGVEDKENKERCAETHHSLSSELPEQPRKLNPKLFINILPPINAIVVIHYGTLHHSV